MQISLQNIHKHYGAVKANNGITLTVEPGTIHGILGENGAGKSTLMKILAGYIQKTSGTIFADKTPVTYRSPSGASDLGIGMLYQDPLDFPPMSLLDNFMLGQTTGVADQKDAFRKKLKEIATHFSFRLNPDAPVKSLTVGERGQLEILRLLAMGVRVLILDEPTTGISATQKEMLFNALKKLASEGKSVVLVSHKLEDVEALCDKVTVLRQGKVAGEMEAPFDTKGLLEMMFGEAPELPPCVCTPPGKDVIMMKDVSASGGRAGLKNCNLVIREGEVVGLAGLEGSGQELFLRISAGLKPTSQGEIFLRGLKMNGRDYHAFQQKRVIFLPSSRLEEGLISGLTISEHFALRNHGKGFLVRWAEAFQKASTRIKKFRISGKPESPVESLSGGNQQRLLLSFLSENPSLLLLENPTRGLDMESAHWVWEHLRLYCERSTAIVFSSSELDEILRVADRVLVFFEGGVVKDVKTEETDSHELGRAIAGKI